MIKRSFRFKVLLAMIVFMMLRNMKRLRKSSPPLGECLLLIAHPDDESMFFSPTLLSMKGRARILCLSNGNMGGKGRVREDELMRVAELIGFKLTISSFEDGGDWRAESVFTRLLLSYLVDPFSVLITFDRNGVSGHKNHVSCYQGARLFLHFIKIRGMFLRSKNLFHKYIIDLNTSETSYVVPFGMYMTPVRMMLLHRSQMVWFRYIYILFSNFMSYNDFNTIN